VQTYWDYLLVAVLGSVVGIAELVSRYRDAPWRAVRNSAAVWYVTLNALAAVSALALIRVFGLTFGGQGHAQQRTLQVLLAGFGALAFLRTSIFILRVGGRDIGIGPVTVLQVILFATDRDVDRRRAVERARAVTDALRGLSFAEVREALPIYCLTLMQNVPADEKAEVEQQLREITELRMEDALKANALGLALMNVVGQKALEAAAAAVRTRGLERGVLGEVYPRLYETLTHVQKSEMKTLDVLGLTLYTAWPNIKAWLDRDGSPLSGWTVSLRVLDPAWLTTGNSFDESWAVESQSLIADVRAYKADNASSLSRHETSISIRTYSLTPAFHGFRVSDSTYFISFMRWDHKTGRFARPLHGYEVILRGDSSPRASQYKQLFDDWVQRVDETGEIA
jgi:hypothetical protein